MCHTGEWIDELYWLDELKFFFTYRYLGFNKHKKQMTAVVCSFNTKPKSYPIVIHDECNRVDIYRALEKYNYAYCIYFDATGKNYSYEQWSDFKRDYFILKLSGLETA